MKKILIIMLTLGIVSGASAQRHGGGGIRGGYGGGTRVIVSAGGYYPFGAYYGFGMPWGYGWGYPYGNGYGTAYRPSRLDMQIEDIKHDYSDKIASARMDQGLTRKEKRYQVKALKRERDNTIFEAKKNYYKK
ncbi:hypothetical protein [Filimonas lacunae]|nr:hypothetical protein [Filimonas lacunae]BAV05189.1 hypothetical protein FLA_1196 [Filimonas lacunae]